ncbi:MAG: histidine kinase dimerization/phospho-acceptor domain-containing protein [Caldimonas sp.]
MTRPSLLRHLLAWVLSALIVVWAGFVAVGFQTGHHEADELTDGHLASVAALLLNLRGSELLPRSEQVASQMLSRPELKSHDYQQSLSVVIWDAQGRVLGHLGEAPVPPFSAAEGFADLVLGSEKTGWRTFARWDRSEPARRLMVMLKKEERDALAFDIAGQVAEPGLWLLPMIALVLGFAIRRGLRPLYELSDDVRAVDVGQQHPLGIRHPQVEFRAIVDSINVLMQRSRSALARERQLADELAHELRTPLASIALHASALQRPLDDDDRRQSLDRLAHDAIRSGHVLSQVLALARASQTEMTEAAQPVDLAALCRRVVSDFAPQALSSGHVLGYCGPSERTRRGHPVLLELALRNLVENAVSHTPAGTSIEVQLDDDGRWLQVRDDGRAQLAAADGMRGPAARLSLGLGLGHRVVEKVAAIHGGALLKVEPTNDAFTTYRISLGSDAADRDPTNAAPRAPAVAGSLLERPGATT